MRFYVGALVAVLLLAGVVSWYASSQPDGLERVAEDEGFLDTADEHPLSDGPLGDYAVEGVENDRLSGGLAGVAGVAATLAVGAGAFAVARARRRDRGPGSAPDAEPGD